MRTYDKRRKEKVAWRNLSQNSVIPKAQMKMPENNIPVVIRKGLVVYINDPSRIEEIKLKYADK